MLNVGRSVTLYASSKVHRTAGTVSMIAREDDDQGGSESLDDEFPLGDGTADTDATVICPYCAETVNIGVDPGSGTSQDYVEDCPVCCQPWRVLVDFDREGLAHVNLEALDG
jgi:hypothetical protein